MATREIWHEILIHASAEKIYAALTKPDQLAHWWTIDVRGVSEVGKTLEFWFSGYRASIMQVVDLHPRERVHWRMTDGLAQDWIGTEVQFNIFKEEGKMLLHFRHSGWSEGARSFPHCSMGWAIFLLSLKEFVETGKGRPHPYDMPVNLWIPPQSAIA